MRIASPLKFIIYFALVNMSVRLAIWINRLRSPGRQLDVVIYNRVPKTGSGTIQNLLSHLSYRNGFEYKMNICWHQRHRSVELQVRSIYSLA